MANKKAAIVDATIRRIAEQGNSFTTGQVASDLSCSQALIFRYYRTKEELLSVCFDRVCHELKVVLRGVSLPKTMTRDSINGYIVEVWRAYCDYLESNSHIARAYMYFVSVGRRYPHGYNSAEFVLRNLLEDDFEKINEAHPDFIFIAEYIIMISNVVAAGKNIEWKNDPDTVRKLDLILRYGILGMGYHVK